MALTLAVLMTGCAGAPGGAGAAPAPAAAAPVDPPAAAEPADPLAAGSMQDPRARDSEISTGPPTRIRIPSIGVDASLEDLRIGEGGQLDPPVAFDTAGWYSGGVVPGAIGPAVIAGHVDSKTAPAVFARIAELSPGDEVIVVMTDGSELSFRVTGATQSAKAAFPTAQVYGTVPAPELRLITCDGDFDATVGHYTDNLIVFATLGG